ncbi:MULTISPECIES: hypothetical protein [Bacillaceae]|uniref:Uncharacterized protein n=1 Tax=Peribacillus huizhouensis TaxID=1501239 RepID=A0ABR6CRH8_9BACI|nr:MULTISPECIES: hypothetical protein [Bacillaceae]MBA9027640.1 hypothetical protein [Peribacillus huizhouensis]
MPQKPSKSTEELNTEKNVQIPNNNQQDKDAIDNLTRMLASLLNYLSDEENEELDIDYIIDDTEGLREWWNQYKESNRKLIEEEIRESLGKLSIEALHKIHEQVKEKQD